jgi:hypothetical protein
VGHRRELPPWQEKHGDLRVKVKSHGMSKEIGKSLCTGSRRLYGLGCLCLSGSLDRMPLPPPPLSPHLLPLLPAIPTFYPSPRQAGPVLPFLLPGAWKEGCHCGVQIADRAGAPQSFSLGESREKKQSPGCLCWKARGGLPQQEASSKGTKPWIGREATVLSGSSPAPNSGVIIIAIADIYWIPSLCKAPS